MFYPSLGTCPPIWLTAPAPIDATRLGRECSFRSGEAPGRHRIPLFTIGRRTDGGQRAKCREQCDHNRWPRTGQGLSTEPEVGPARGGQEGTPRHLRLHAPSGYHRHGLRVSGTSPGARTIPLAVRFRAAGAVHPPGRELHRPVCWRDGLGRVWPRMLRHSCGHHLADKGTNLRTMQDCLEHRDPKHRAHYMRCPVPVRGAVAAGLRPKGRVFAARRTTETATERPYPRHVPLIHPCWCHVGPMFS